MVSITGAGSPGHAGHTEKIMKNALSRFFLAIALLFLSSLSFVPYGALAADKVIGIYASQAISNSMPWIAQEAGLFRKYNLDFQLIYVPSAGISTAALLGGDAEIAMVGGLGVIRAFVAGATEPVIIGGVKNVLTHSILAGQKIKKPEDLKGKKVGVTRIGSNSHYFTIQALRRFGLDPDRDITFVQTGGAPEVLAALVKGVIDGGTMTSPGDAKAIAQGFHYVVYGPDLHIPYSNSGIVTRRSVIVRRPQVVGQFMRAMAEAVKILHSDKEFTYRVLAKELRMDDPKVLDAAYNAEIKVLEPRLAIQSEGVQAILDEVSQIDPRARKVKPQELIDRRFLDEMEKSGFFRRLWAQNR